MALPRVGLRTRLRGAVRSLRDVRHRTGLRRLERDAPAEYRAYLDTQLRRTLSKRDNDPGAGARVLVREFVGRGGLGAGSSVLCIGCRNPVELDLLRDAGVGHVMGIDLFSQRDDILVMDMHALTFDDGTFDGVYCSHALEHSFDPAVVVGEIGRVARPGAAVAVEVPLGDRRSEADHLEFRTVDDLRAAVAPIVGSELYGEEQPARSPTNDQGTPIARVVVRVAAPSGGGRTIVS